MTKSEIMRYLHSDWRRMHVDVRRLDDPNGLLQMTTITLGHRAMVSFLSAEEYQMGVWENLVYSGYYPNWDALFEALERYLEYPLQDWQNFNEHPRSVADLANLDIHSAQVVAKVHGRHLRLPAGTTYTLPSIYWRQIETYGNFDMERESQDDEDD